MNLIAKIMTTRNVGPLDRALRTLPAVAVAALVLTGHLDGAVAWVLGSLAAALLVTAIFGACSIYYLLGFSTCPVAGKPRPE